MNGESIAAQPLTRERRSSRSRRTLELVLDGFFRPKHWAAALSYRVGLQGGLRRVETTIAVANRPADAPPLRIAFGSDFHAGPTTDPRQLQAACDALVDFEADVLLLGGDFVSVRAGYIDLLAPLFAEIPAPLGKFAVLGNHDLRANYPVIVRWLEHAGVEMLTNRRAQLPAPFDDIAICGLDDFNLGRPNPALSVDPPAGTRVVLMHSPDGLQSLGERDFDIALCGHTHGGQVALPSGKPVLVPGGELNRLYPSGLFDLSKSGNRKLLVSRGVGCSTLPVRLFAQPEVHLVVITGSASP
jgi:predicted MPP superfamily phosphohydrolase